VWPKAYRTAVEAATIVSAIGGALWGSGRASVGISLVCVGIAMVGAAAGYNRRWLGLQGELFVRRRR
jgi:hypothetical protein